MTIACGQCGEPIVAEATSGDPAARKPCPKCGSLARTLGVQQHETVTTTATLDATVVTYPQNLLVLARALIDEGRYGIGVVVAHMACEVAVERSLADGFRNRGIQDLEDTITGFLNGYNLASNRNRHFYAALTGDQIQCQAFWADFKTSAQRRNNIIHNSLIVGKADAEHSLKAATDLVTHLNK